MLGYTKPIDGTKDFYKIIDQIDNEKSRHIKNIFNSVDESWGDLIRSLRDKIVHYDLIKTNYKFRPTLKGKSYEEFSQEMTNYMFYLLIDLCVLLFEVEWVSGSFEEFNNKYVRHSSSPPRQR